MSARAVGAPVPTERPGPDGSALIRFRHVFKIYRVADTGVVALGGVDFDIAEGEFVAIVGPSGSGKSTILNMIGGLDRATAGIVEVEGATSGGSRRTSSPTIGASASGSCGRAPRATSCHT